MSTVLEALKGYRTFIVNGGVMLAAALVGLHVLQVAPTADAAGQAFDGLLAAITGTLAAVNAVMRLFTTTAPGQKV